MTRWHRLIRDYEKRVDVSGPMIKIAMGSLLLCCIGYPKPISNIL